MLTIRRLAESKSRKAGGQGAGSSELGAWSMGQGALGLERREDRTRNNDLGIMKL